MIVKLSSTVVVLCHLGGQAPYHIAMRFKGKGDISWEARPGVQLQPLSIDGSTIHLHLQNFDLLLKERKFSSDTIAKDKRQDFRNLHLYLVLSVGLWWYQESNPDPSV